LILVRFYRKYCLNAQNFFTLITLYEGLGMRNNMSVEQVIRRKIEIISNKMKNYNEKKLHMSKIKNRKLTIKNN